ncbi:helix-turn-helix domain-containing protein [Roseomonas sp. CCTCC AB2023176]|uniref:helix-turn-helix domain-containing protein n=1 Tax=Roseomonas sp. CCTCC AB2023176 TaxID=3342640 RepID=UPI0035D898FC
MDPVPRFRLYGEDGAAPEARFLHLETIPARSAPNAWRIAPHRHPAGGQVLLLTRGGGRLTADGAMQAMAAPVLLLIPPAVVHGFDFAPATDGWVLTAGERLLAEAAEPLPLADAPRLLPLARPAARDAARLFRALAAEYAGDAPGRDAALLALLRLLLILVSRQGTPPAAAPSGDAALLARFRTLVERWYREHRPLPDYLRALGTTEKRLATACRAATGRSPKSLIHARLIAEAERSLAYTARPVSQVAYALGFRDAAYFSRFYRRHAGVAPRAARGR